jgi:hypothetical protein
VIQYRPASGAGSCAHCLGELGLDALKQAGVWYCCHACAEGRAPERDAAVPAPRLYHRPARFFRKRLPKELRSAGPKG